MATRGTGCRPAPSVTQHRRYDSYEITEWVPDPAAPPPCCSPGASSTTASAPVRRGQHRRSSSDWRIERSRAPNRGILIPPTVISAPPPNGYECRGWHSARFCERLRMFVGFVSMYIPRGGTVSYAGCVNCFFVEIYLGAHGGAGPSPAVMPETLRQGAGQIGARAGRSSLPRRLRRTGPSEMVEDPGGSGPASERRRPGGTDRGIPESPDRRCRHHVTGL